MQTKKRTMFKLKLKSLTKLRQNSKASSSTAAAEEKERIREQKKLTISGPISLDGDRGDQRG